MTPQHLCHARNCETPVPRRMFMCRKHWNMVPKRMKSAIWDAYVPGQENSLDISDEYLEATRVAINHVAVKEAAQL